MSASRVRKAMRTARARRRSSALAARAGVGRARLLKVLKVGRLALRKDYHIAAARFGGDLDPVNTRVGRGQVLLEAVLKLLLIGFVLVLLRQKVLVKPIERVLR